MNRKRQEFAILIILLSTMALGMGSSFKTDHERAHASCKVNLVNLAVAMEFYSTYHKGRYPDSLGKVHPVYIEAMPNCPLGESYLIQTGASAPDKEFSKYDLEVVWSQL